MNCANCGSEFGGKFMYCPECGAAKEATSKPESPLSPVAPKSVPIHNAPMAKLAILVFLSAVCLSQAIFFTVSFADSLATGISGVKTSREQISLEAEKYNNGFFSMDKPKGWRITTGGQGPSFCYMAQDPRDPLRQIVYYGEFGPVYLSQRQQHLDRYYVSMGGYRSSWLDAPVVNPLTPENYLRNVPQLLQTQAIRSFMATEPAWRNIRIIEVRPQENAFPVPGAKTALIRALFTRNDRLGEGLFLVTTFTLIPETGSPGAGLGYSFSFTAVTASQQDFRFAETNLIKSANSAKLSRAYLSQAAMASNDQWAGVFAAGQTLRQSTDILMKGWQQHDKTSDIIAENRADAMRGVQRVYDPDTREVYTVDNRFYGDYNIHRNKFQMNNLQLVPPDSPLLLQPSLSGAQHIR